MEFERRGNGTYYYKKERKGGRFVSRYVGTGEAAYLISQLNRVEGEEKDFKLNEEQLRRKKAEKEKVNYNDF
jgi:hypothetical protein